MIEFQETNTNKSQDTSHQRRKNKTNRSKDDEFILKSVLVQQFGYSTQIVRYIPFKHFARSYRAEAR